MRRVYFVGMLLILLLFLVGCADINTTLTINRNGSADLTQMMLLEQNLIKMVGGLEQFEKDFKEQGYQVQYLDEDGKVGLKATKHFADANQVFDQQFSSNHKLFKRSNGDGESEFKVSKGFLFTDYKINCQIDLQGNQTTNKTRQINRLMANMVMNFKLNLPVRPNFHNANKVSEDGKTLEWLIIAGQNNNIQVSARQVNYLNIIIVLGVIGLTGLIVILALMRRIDSKTEDSTDAVA
ncbi:MAG TPA: hypothetical protein PLZ08_09695 [Bacillota bacterium]|nr:hypothetical protein [Bacillota bacterium]HOL09753.1 hypothetical protein [Bacillota bacterium]HPO98210.1 hypothetical protein [Bacillota bacterium]